MQALLADCLKALKDMSRPGKPPANDDMDDTDAAIEKYFLQCENMNIKDEFSDQVRRRALNERNIDKDRVEQLDLLYISSLFDLSEWWNIVGRKCLNLMFLLVPNCNSTFK